MKNSRNISIGLLIISISYIFFSIHYYILYPLYLGTEDQLIKMLLFQSKFSAFTWFDISLTIIGLIAVTYGFLNRKNWARVYMIAYNSYSSFWAFFSMFILKWQVYEHFIYLILYVFIVTFLLLSDVKTYFKNKD